MGQMIIKWYLIFLLVGLACISCVSAATIDISPHQVFPGDVITVTAHGLKDGSEVTMNLKTIINNPGPNYKMEIGNMFFPIYLDHASFMITNENTYSNTLLIDNNIPEVGRTFITIGGKSVNDRWTGQLSGGGRDDINGTFNLIRASGITKLGGASQVISTMQWNGVKMRDDEDNFPWQVDGGPDDFMISFTQNGIKSGSIEVTILVNGTEAAYDNIIIGSPVIESPKGATTNGTVKNTRANIISKSVPMTVKLSAIDSETGNASSRFSQFMINKAPAYMRNFALLK